MSEGLKACPFCGGHDFDISVPFYAFVRCLGCGSEGPPLDTKAEAITAWNTRAGENA